MKNWEVELSTSYTFCTEVEAETEEEAIKLAKEIACEDEKLMCDEDWEVESITPVEEKNDP